MNRTPSHLQIAPSPWSQLRFALTALVATLALAAPAAAAPFTPELEADLAFAQSWWGRTPTGCSSFTTELVPLGALTIDGVEAAGRATQPEPGTSVPCWMGIEEPRPGALSCQLLETVVHEYGHWLGEGHSDDPASIMYIGDDGPALLCEAEWRATYMRSVRNGLHGTQRRCRHKTKPAQRSWCRYQLAQWRKMLAHPPGWVSSAQ